MPNHVLPATRDLHLNSCVRREWRKRLNETSICTDVFRTWAAGAYFLGILASEAGVTRLYWVNYATSNPSSADSVWRAVAAVTAVHLYELDRKK